MERRRRLLERGRVGVSKHQQVQLPPPQPTPGKSQGPLHGQGIGVGLIMLSLGGNATQKGGSASRPLVTSTATTARPGGSVGSLAVNLPTYVANQWVVVNLAGKFLTSTDTASAAGWTAAGVVASGQRILFGFYRKMTGSEGSTVTFSFSTAFEQPFAITATYTNTTGIETSKPTNLQNPVSSWLCGPLTTTGQNRTIVALAYEESGGVDFGTVTLPGGQRAHYSDTAFGLEAGIIADMAAPAAGNYSMGGTLTGAATAHSILLGLF